MSKKVALTGTNLKFEPKYINHMINAITFNSWHGHQAFSICLPYLQEKEGNG